MGLLGDLFKKKKPNSIVGNLIRQVTGKDIPKDQIERAKQGNKAVDAAVAAYKRSLPSGQKPDPAEIQRIQQETAVRWVSEMGIQGTYGAEEAQNAILMAEASGGGANNDVLDALVRFTKTDSGRELLNVGEEALQHLVKKKVIKPVTEKIVSGTDSGEIADMVTWEYIKAWVKQNWLFLLVPGGLIAWLIYRGIRGTKSKR